MSVNAMKVAMIYEASLPGELKTISLQSVTLACKLIERVKDDLCHLLTSDLAFTESERNLQRIRKQLINNARGIERSTVLKNSNLLARDFNEAIRTLQDRGDIEVIDVATKTKTKKVYRWIGE